MPLTPSTTDKFLKVGVPGTATTLAAPGYTIGNSSINVGSTSNWSTDTPVIFAIDNAQVVNGVATRIAGSYCEFFGIVASSTSIGNLALQYGSAQNYVAGSLTRVYIPVTGTRENMLIDGLNQDHNGRGNHKDLTGTNQHTTLGTTDVASAANNLRVTNAIAGAAPLLSAEGSDTNVDLQINPKGTGVVKTDGAAPRQFFALYNFIESGCVWTADAPGSTLLASMTGGFVWIGGKRLIVAAVSHRAFTPSVDTYVDFQDNLDGTAKIIYTTATNNAASPAIPNALTDATNVRNAIVVSGATSIATAASVNQGQESMLLPIASSVPYAVTDSLGNLICPRDPARKLLGMRQILADFTTNNSTASGLQITGLSVPVIIPAGRKIKATVVGVSMSVVTSGNSQLQIWEGVVGSGTQIAANTNVQPGQNAPGYAERVYTPASSSLTYNASLRSTASNNATVSALSTAPTFLKIELE